MLRSNCQHFPAPRNGSRWPHYPAENCRGCWLRRRPGRKWVPPWFAPKKRSKRNKAPIVIKGQSHGNICDCNFAWWHRWHTNSELISLNQMVQWKMYPKKRHMFLFIHFPLPIGRETQAPCHKTADNMAPETWCNFYSCPWSMASNLHYIASSKTYGNTMQLPKNWKKINKTHLVISEWF